MKRGRIYSVTDSNNSKRGWKKTEESTQYSGSSFSDLPRDILVNILLRLPVKRIFVSKCVCKTWYELVSDPEFAKFYFDQAEVYPLIKRFRSRMVYLVQPDKADFELKLGMCDHCFFMPGCVCNVEVKLDTKFELPGRNERIKPRMKDEECEYDIVNSCNGLLCLCTKDPDDPLIVCNPITSEFINLPIREVKKQCNRDINYGFGFCSATNQYKVIRLSRHDTQIDYMAEVHILGTKTWKDIGCFTKSMSTSFPTYLNGFLYWFSDRRPLTVLSFDIGRECFKLVSGPAMGEHCIYARVGVLGGELCISVIFKFSAIHVWALKDYGTEKAWSKVLSFDLYSSEARHCSPFRPIKYLNDGALLCDSYTNALIYMDLKKNRIRSLKVHDIESVTSHIPSFVSLKHALSGQNVTVLNVNSRWAELKLQGEAKDIDLVEEEFYRSSDSSSDYDSDSSSSSDSDSGTGIEIDSTFDSDSYSDPDSDYDSSSETDSII